MHSEAPARPAREVIQQWELLLSEPVVPMMQALCSRLGTRDAVDSRGMDVSRLLWRQLVRRDERVACPARERVENRFGLDTARLASAPRWPDPLPWLQTTSPARKRFSWRCCGEKIPSDVVAAGCLLHQNASCDSFTGVDHRRQDGRFDGHLWPMGLRIERASVNRRRLTPRFRRERCRNFQGLNRMVDNSIQ